ncbi:hypothetical protein FOZ60_009047 [Perkinsus olseni]|uniref:Uncharacterized protein n=1 Tax=Perkinsus olseni TaxID=32597 RepID=A0A7J6NHY1_PEROL|nr:hypothetical protein FOZ60_009047 [Perkinsus olseni]
MIAASSCIFTSVDLLVCRSLGVPVGSAKCDDPTYCVSLGNSPNSCSLATGDCQGVLHLWDVRQFASLSSHYPSDHNKPYIDAVASHAPLSSVEHAQDDSVIITAGLDGAVRLWSSWSADCLRTLGAGASGTECMGATIATRDIRDKSASVYVAGLYSDGLARVWDLRSNRSMRLQPVVGRSPSQSSPESTSTKAPSTGEEEKIKNLCRPCISMWRAGRELDSPLLYIPGLDRRLYAVDLLSGRPIAKSPVGHTCPISSICCCSTGEVLVSTGYSRDASAMVWRVWGDGTVGSLDEEIDELPEEAFHEVPPQIAGLKVL